jgi:hypothetical protein
MKYFVELIKIDENYESGVFNPNFATREFYAKKK